MNLLCLTQMCPTTALGLLTVNTGDKKMTNSLVILTFVLLFTKHLIADFLLQGPYQYLNKGTYGHPGGILHSWNQVAFTWILIMPLLPTIWTTVLIVGLIEGVIHYHIDWAKMNINKYYNLGPTTSERFWFLLGADQFLHYMTYAGMVLWFVHVSQ